MRWICEHCLTRHETAEQQQRCNRARRSAKRLTIIVLAAIIVAILGGALVWNQYAYGDWKCTFMHCRKIVK